MHNYMPMIPQPRWQDVLDVLIVAYVIYRIALLIRGTRTMQMVLGMVIVGGAFVASQVLGLFTLNWLLNNFLGSLFVILVVIFQADIRRALTRVGAQSFLGRNTATATPAEEIATAAAWCSARRVGALIVIEQDDGLGEFVETGKNVFAGLGLQNDDVRSRDAVIGVDGGNHAAHLDREMRFGETAVETRRLHRIGGRRGLAESLHRYPRSWRDIIVA